MLQELDQTRSAPAVLLTEKATKLSWNTCPQRQMYHELRISQRRWVQRQIPRTSNDLGTLVTSPRHLDAFDNTWLLRTERRTLRLVAKNWSVLRFTEAQLAALDPLSLDQVQLRPARSSPERRAKARACGSLPSPACTSGTSGRSREGD